jgi:hypothetical protein
MAAINGRKRAAYRRRVQAVLVEILNDPAIMPNADCRDLVVSISQVEFGKTVREIYIEARGQWQQPTESWEKHDQYAREAEQRRESTYADLTDVFLFPHLTEAVAQELQKRLGLLYTPTIHRLCDIGEQ